MRSFGRQSTAKHWARFAMKIGLLLTDAKLWADMSDQLRERASDVGDGMRERYEDTADRLRDARMALQGRNQWLTPTATFLGGVGIGVGLGLLFAPASGEETRATLRDRAVDATNKMADIATGVTRSGSFATGSPSTGTHGD
jgi:gas vesicle protein